MRPATARGLASHTPEDRAFLPPAVGGTGVRLRVSELSPLPGTVGAGGSALKTVKVNRKILVFMSATAN